MLLTAHNPVQYAFTPWSAVLCCAMPCGGPAGVPVAQAQAEWQHGARAQAAAHPGRSSTTRQAVNLCYRVTAQSLCQRLLLSFCLLCVSEGNCANLLCAPAVLSASAFSKRRVPLTLSTCTALSNQVRVCLSGLSRRSCCQGCLQGCCCSTRQALAALAWAYALPRLQHYFVLYSPLASCSKCFFSCQFSGVTVVCPVLAVLDTAQCGILQSVLITTVCAE